MPARNVAIGHLTLTRGADEPGGTTAYDIDHTINLNGWESGMKSTMQCSGRPSAAAHQMADRVRNHSLKEPGRSWRLTENGSHKNGVLEIASKAGARRFNTDRPVARQWLVIDALRTAKADPSDPIASVEFDLLHDLTSYRPRQKLKPVGFLRSVSRASRTSFTGSSRWVPESSRTDYWVDATGRPLIVTGGLLASALTSVQPV